MKNYLDVLQNVIDNGRVKGNRTGVGTKYIFSEKFRHRMADGFPLLTTKKINARAVLGELFGFLTGVDTVQGFHDFDCKIWDSWGLKEDFIQKVYKTPDELNEEIAAKLNITVSEAAAKMDALVEANTQWSAKLSNHLTGQGEEGFNVEEFTKNAPQTPLQYCNGLGISLHRDEGMFKGYLGPIYGKQWLEWRTAHGEMINQIQRISHQLANHSNSRRMVLLGWNPGDTPADTYPQFPNGRITESSSDQVQCAIMDGKQALPPCHLMVILDVDSDAELGENFLNMEVIMRSTDVPIGLPYNIASYAFLMEMICSEFGFVAGDLVIEMVNCHVYADQIDLAKEQLERIPGKLPTLKRIPSSIKFHDPKTLTKEAMDLILEGLEGYEPQKHIPYPVAV